MYWRVIRVSQNLYKRIQSIVQLLTPSIFLLYNIIYEEFKIMLNSHTDTVQKGKYNMITSLLSI